MIDVQEAAQIAVKYGPGAKFPLHHTAVDVGECWLFSFDHGASLDEIIPPGLPGAVLVAKKDGAHSYPPTPATEPDRPKLEKFYQQVGEGKKISIFT